MEEQVVEFLGALGAQNRSVHTLAAYRNDLYQFIRFVKEYSTPNACMVESWRGVDAQLAADYVRFLATNQGCSEATIARKIASLRSFYAFLLRCGKADANPMDELQLPAQKRQAPQSLRPEDMTCLLNSRTTADNHYALRDRALLELLCLTGLRQTEAIGLTMSDVDWEAKRIHGGAGKKRRWLALQPTTFDALIGYVTDERPHLKRAAEEQILFLNHLGKPLSRQGVWLIVQRCAVQAGIGGDVTPLTLRHTFAMRQIADGADMQAVRRRLGLISPASTQVYRQAARQNAPELEIDGVAVS